jgi:hypothetical protein
MVDRVQLPAQEAGAIDPAAAAPAAGGNPPAPASPSAERPAWLPEKFATVEDMAKAYGELEGKLGAESAEQPGQEQGQQEQQQQDQNQEQQAAEQALTVAGLDMTEFSTQFASDGKLSDESYAKLEAAGFPKSVVDTYIAGQTAQANAAQEVSEQQLATILQPAGGKEGFDDLVKWAVQALPKEAIEEFNAVIDTGHVPSMKLAVANLVARQKDAEGSEPSLLKNTGGRPSADVFQSRFDADAAMADPRYGKDPSYTKAVEQKLIRSNVF